MPEVIAELYNISDVSGLGLNLGIRMSALEIIEKDYRSSRDQLRMVIYHWLIRRGIGRQKQNEHPTWGALADAVSPINHALAMRVRDKYCC